MTLFFFWAWMLYNQYQVWRWGRVSRNWPKTTGRVIVSGTTFGNLKRLPKYGVKIVYAYTVDGVLYTSSRYMFGIRWGMDQYTARNIVARYQPEQIIKVHYHPERPRLAVLRPGIDGVEYVYGLIVNALVLGIWVVMLWAFLK